MPVNGHRYGAAESAADLAAYYRLRRWGAAASALAGGAIACLLVPVAWYAALAFAVGVACGVANVLAIMRAGERLVDTRSPIFFGLSSLLRLAGFSIVAAALAARGPWWSLGPFLVGFFFPLAVSAWGALRIFRRKPERHESLNE